MELVFNSQIWQEFSVLENKVGKLENTFKKILNVPIINLISLLATGVQYVLYLKLNKYVIIIKYYMPSYEFGVG